MRNTSPRRLFVSLRIKLVIGFTLLFSLTFGGASYWIYRLETQDMLRRMGEELTATLQGAVLGMDSAQTAALAQDGLPNEDGFSDDPRYSAELDWFAQVKSIEPRAWLYSYVRGASENQVLFVADLWRRYDDSRAAGFLEPFEDTLLTGCLDEQAVDTKPTCDKWGCWVSACAPLKDAQGNSVAALGLDFEAGQVIALQQRIQRNILLVFVITYSLGVLLVYWLAGLFSRPLQALAGQAEQVSEGHYNLDFIALKPGRVPDEIGKLAQVFQVMVSKVYQREQTLVEQVHALQIEIDEVKAQRAVREITETDFFRDLQIKAKKMRMRKK